MAAGSREGKKEVRDRMGRKRERPDEMKKSFPYQDIIRKRD